MKIKVILTVIFFAISLLATDIIVPQNCIITKSTGTVQVWLKDKGRWVRPDEIKDCKAGSTVQISSGSQLIVTMEPAISVTLEENTVLSFDKMLIDHAKKNIRMVLHLEKGIFRIKMEPLFGNTALLSMTTPTASVDMNNAEAAVRVSGDTTTVELMAGTAKLRQINSTTKSLLSAGTRAVISSDKSDITVSSLAEDRKSAMPPKNMKVAILSIQSSTVARDNLERVSDFIAQEVERKSSTKVLFLEDIRAMLQSEGYESLLSCYTDSCLSKIGNVLGVDAVIIGGLGQLGNNYLFNLKMIDVLRNNVLNRENVRVSGDISRILDEIPNMVEKIVTQPANAPSAAAPAGAALTDQTKGNDSEKKYHETVAWIKGGTFVMGSKAAEGDADESPQHNVTLNGFYIDKYEVSRADFEKVMGFNPSTTKGCDECPVDNVSWSEAQDYCSKIGKRLPTEAEWEYACRAGTTTAFSFGSTLTSDQADFNGKFPYGGGPEGPDRGKSMPAGSFKANAWNLYDMHGNVAEWCSDWYDASYYGNSEKANPAGPKDGKLKVVRGGAWNQKGTSLRSARRSGYNPIMRLNTIGFRCVKTDSNGN